MPEKRSSPLENRAVPLGTAADWLWLGGGRESDAGELVNDVTAMQISTIFPCKLGANCVNNSIRSLNLHFVCQCLPSSGRVPIRWRQASQPFSQNVCAMALLDYQCEESMLQVGQLQPLDDLETKLIAAGVGALAGAVAGFIVTLLGSRWKLWKLHRGLKLEILPSERCTCISSRS
jgi:hypothetical protein